MSKVNGGHIAEFRFLEYDQLSALGGKGRTAERSSEAATLET